MDKYRYNSSPLGVEVVLYVEILSAMSDRILFGTAGQPRNRARALILDNDVPSSTYNAYTEFVQTGMDVRLRRIQWFSVLYFCKNTSYGLIDPVLWSEKTQVSSLLHIYLLRILLKI